MKLILILCTVFVSVLKAEKQMLFDKSFKGSTYLGKFEKKDGVIKVKIPSGKAWPSFGILSNKPIDLYNFANVAAEIKNLSSKDQTFFLTVKDSDGKKTVGSGIIKAGQKSTVTTILKRKDESWNNIELFGIRTAPWMEKSSEPANLRKVKSISIALQYTSKPLHFEVHSINVGGEYTGQSKPPTPFFPMIDQFGQYKHKFWDGKVKSAKDLMKAKKQESFKPLFANKYGSFESDKTFPAKGAFYVTKKDGKWLLIDPEGKPFYSMGMNSVNFSRATPYSKREKWFDIPANSPRIQKNTRKVFFGFYKGKKFSTVDFLHWNLERKYGNDYKDQLVERTLKRFRAWGVNTVGAWSEGSLYARNVPYTVILHPWSPGLKSSMGFYGAFPDVFHKSFALNVEKKIQNIDKKILKDPYCIGIFIHNELPWGNATDLARWTLGSKANQPAKQVFVADLKKQFSTIAELNKKWGSKFDSWDQLLKNPASVPYNRAFKELTAFSQKYADTYFKTCRDLIRKNAPRRLYLGSRFAQNNEVASAAAVKYCDVVSANLYYPHTGIGGYKLPGQKKDAAPIIIGEFHYGAKDRGFAKGLRGGETQKERNAMVAEYIKSCMKHPGFVGSHWFQMYDQPVSGRVLDGENYHVGFVDITDTPYKGLINTLKKVMSEGKTHYLNK